MVMYKKALILILFASLLSFTTVSYAEDNSLKALMAQVSVAHNKITAIQKENKELKKQLAVKEKKSSTIGRRLKRLKRR